MATKQDLPATDSAAVLHTLVGDDATAAFESDPNFISSNPAVSGSSENLQTHADRADIQAQPNLKLAVDEDDEEDEDDLEDDEDDEEDEDDLEDDDEVDEDDEDEDDEEYEDVDDDEDEDEEDEDEE